MNDEYILFPEFHPVQTKTDLQIARKVRQKRIDRLVTLYWGLIKYMKYQIKIVDGHSYFPSIGQARWKLNMMQKLTTRKFQRFIKNTNIAFGLNHTVIQLEQKGEK